MRTPSRIVTVTSFSFFILYCGVTVLRHARRLSRASTSFGHQSKAWMAGTSSAMTQDDPLTQSPRRHATETTPDRQSERLCGGEIDDEVELGRLLDGKFGRIGAFQDFVDVVAGTPEQLDIVCP